MQLVRNSAVNYMNKSDPETFGFSRSTVDPDSLEVAG